MAHEPEKERRWRVREYNAVGTLAALMFLGLLLIGAAIAILLAPAIVPTPPPVQDEHVSEE